MQDMLKTERDSFQKHDLNKNGKLCKAEIKAMVIPDIKKNADKEADHLIKETDTDKDGKCRKKEIEEKYETWVGSAATQYGKDIHDEETHHDPEEL